jgi:hypothetical protein
MSISMIVPGAIGALKSFNTVLSAGDKTLISQLALRRASNALMEEDTAKTITNTVTRRISN